MRVTPEKVKLVLGEVMTTREGNYGTIIKGFYGALLWYDHL